MTVIYGIVVVCGACLVAVGGLTLVQRLVPATIRKEHNDVAGFIYAALGVIYAVLLALVVIAVWEEYQAASATAEQEANALAEIFWLAHRLPEPEGISGQPFKGTSHAPRPGRSSTQKGWTKSSGWRTQGGCAWSLPRRAYPPYCGWSWLLGEWWW
jgi:hypothetical protein